MLQIRTYLFNIQYIKYKLAYIQTIKKIKRKGIQVDSTIFCNSKY